MLNELDLILSDPLEAAVNLVGSFRGNPDAVAEMLRKRPRLMRYVVENANSGSGFNKGSEYYNTLWRMRKYYGIKFIEDVGGRFTVHVGRKRRGYD